jgi:large subunit ribosomal protein L24
MKRIKKGDDVIVVAGKDKGRRGTVLNVIDDNDRVLVEGINMVKKHQKPNPNAGVQGGIVEQERPIHVSNVMIFNPVTGKGDRIGVKTLEDGRKVRFFKSNNEVVDV